LAFINADNISMKLNGN